MQECFVQKLRGFTESFIACQGIAQPVRCEVAALRSPGAPACLFYRCNQSVFSRRLVTYPWEECWPFLFFNSFTSFFFLFFSLHSLARDAQYTGQFLISWNSLFPIIKKKERYICSFLWLLLAPYWMFVPNQTLDIVARLSCEFMDKTPRSS